MIKILNLLFGWIPELINMRKARAEAMTAEFLNFRILITTLAEVIETMRSEIKDMKDSLNVLLLEIRSLNELLCDCLNKLK